jgi:hypothetical protein
MTKYSDLLEKINNFFLLSIAKSTPRRTMQVVYGPYARPDGRKIVVIKDSDGKSRTVSYPKYLMEEHLGRRLDPNTETVDHINRDKHDNDINNLRLVPRSQHSADDTRRVKLVEFTCSMCGNKFERSPRLIRDKAKKGKSGPFCGRACAGRYARKLQLKQIDKQDAQTHIESEYYRNIKNVAEVASFYFKKYGATLTPNF